MTSCASGRMPGCDSEPRALLRCRSCGRLQRLRPLHLGTSYYRSKLLVERRKALAQLKFAAPILLSVPLPGTPEEIEQVVRAAGLEGVVARRLDSIYEQAFAAEIGSTSAARRQ
jgi:hypothetical protein